MNMNLLSNIKSFIGAFRRKVTGSVNSSFFKIFSLLLIISLLSCSEDLDVSGGYTNNLNGDYITVDFFIPEPERVVTRSYDTDEERTINNLTIAIYNSDKSKMLQLEEVTSYDANGISGEFPNDGTFNEFRVKIKKNDELKKENGTLALVAVANTITDDKNDYLKGVEGYGQLLKKTSDKYILGEKGFFMSGEATLTGSTIPAITLVRSCAKIQVKDETGDTDKFVLKGFDIWRPAKECYVVAGIKTGDSRYSNEYLEGFVYDDADNDDSTTEKPNIRYPFPTKTHNGDDIITYLVIEGVYEGTTCYYAIPLYSQTEHKHFNIEPNHYYEVILKEVNHKGQVRDDATNTSGRRMAVANPCDYIIYEIHDHAPEVLSMKSDGVHELGVTHIVELNQSEEVDGKTVMYGYLTVKCYSARQAKEDDIEADDIDFDDAASSTSWFEIDFDGVETLTGSQIDNSFEGDKDNPGTQFRYKVRLKEARYSEQSQTINVKWTKYGLDRDVTIHYDPGFVVSQVADVTLLIKDESERVQYEIENYLHFLQGTQDTYKISGLDENSMADGKIRNRGFHFPMPYGNEAPGSPWTYTYDIDFSKLQTQMQKEDVIKGTGNGFVKIDYEVTQDAPNGHQQAGTVLNTSNVKWAPNSSDPCKGTLKWDPLKASSYDYASGKIIFKITYNTTENNEIIQKTRNLSLDLYHTGFFHHDSSENYSAGLNEGKEFLYYEVVPMEGMYWLDRNIGARSNKMYVDNSTGGTSNEYTGLGDVNARGLFIKISKYTDYQYTSPVIETGMCPPGYHIPNTTEWTSVRLSEKFIDERVTDENNNNYTTTYYNSNVGKVYFPRAKYWYSNDNSGGNLHWYEPYASSGDPSVGYYWTASEAQGMEKNEMGRWVRALYLTGSTSTYMNYDVVTSKLNMRCVAGAKIIPQDNQYVSFNVHNATHVYLFDKTTKAPLYTFPGHALGTEASGSQWQYFSCTVSTDVDNIGLLFANVSLKGIVTLFTKDGAQAWGFDEKYAPFQIIINNAVNDPDKYWNVEIGHYYDFCKFTKENFGDNVTDHNPTYNNKGEYIDPEEVGEGHYYCDAPDDNAIGGGGSYKFEKEYDREEVLWTGQLTANSWDDKLYDLNNGEIWKNVPEGSTLKIYLVYDSDFTLQIHKGNWTGQLIQCKGTSENSYNHPSIKNPAAVTVIEIGVTNWLSDLINNNGMIIQGQNYSIIGITYDPEGKENGQGDEDEDITKLHPSPFNWSGNKTIEWGNAWDPLAGGAYDWSQVPAGTVLRITFKSTGGQFNVLDGNWGHIGDDGIWPSGTTYDYEINKNRLRNFRNGKGLLIQGENLTIIAATLIFPEGTGSAQ